MLPLGNHPQPTSSLCALSILPAANLFLFYLFFVGVSFASLSAALDQGVFTPQFFEVLPEDVAFHQPAMHRLLLGSGQPFAGMGWPLGKTPYVTVGF